MGLFRAASGAIGGMLGDQWLDFYTVPDGIADSAALFPACLKATGDGRGSNTKGSTAIISNGSKIVVPEGYGLLLLQDGAITGFVSEPGGYIWDSEDVYSESIFAGNSATSSLILQSWERFKFGGRPGGQQLSLFIRLKELPNNKFGTQSEVYWDDAFFNTQVGAVARGTFSYTIVDPLKFAVQFVPARFLQGKAVFDFQDRENAAARQLLSELVGSLASAFSLYSNDPAKENRITKIQQDSVGFASALSEAVEAAYGWRDNRGIEISQVSIVGIEYDPQTKELLKTVQRADALSGSRGNANLQASVAEGIQAAGFTSGSEGILGLGIAGGSIGLAGMMQASQASSPSATDEVVSKLESLKRALDAGLISQADYDLAKAKALGL